MKDAEGNQLEEGGWYCAKGEGGMPSRISEVKDEYPIIHTYLFNGEIAASPIDEEYAAGLSPMNIQDYLKELSPELKKHRSKIEAAIEAAQNQPLPTERKSLLWMKMGH